MTYVYIISACKVLIFFGTEVFNLVSRLLVGNKAKGELHLRDSDLALLLQTFFKNKTLPHNSKLCSEVSLVQKHLNPGFPFRILSHDFSPKLQDKILNRKPGLEATKTLQLVNT